VPDTLPEEPFPPPRHAISLLGVDVEVGPGTEATGWWRVRPDASNPSGTPGLGPIGLMIDIVAGTSAVVAAAPDYIYTADMTIHLVPGVRVDEVVSRVHVRRRGRRTLVQEIALRDGSGATIGWGTTTFVIAAPPPDGPDLRDHHGTGRTPFWPLAADDEPPRFRDELGLRHDGPGEVSVDLRWQVANNVGALNGGVQAQMIDEACASLGRLHLGAGAETTDAHIAFLQPGRSGPFRAVASMVGDPAPEGDRLAAEVTLLDADGAICTFATAAVVVP
jgi:acyl-coenzyme A thioesterase PaaI-like protein